MENAGFLSSCDRDIRVPIKFQWMSQASCHVEAWDSAFLLCCKRGVRPPVEFRRGLVLFLELQRCILLSLKRELGIALKALQGKITSFGFGGKSWFFLSSSGKLGVLLKL